MCSNVWIAGLMSLISSLSSSICSFQRAVFIHQLNELGFHYDCHTLECLDTILTILLFARGVQTIGVSSYESVKGVKPSSSANSALPPSSPPKLLKSLRSTAAFGSKMEDVPLCPKSSIVPTWVVTVAGDPKFEGEKLSRSLDFNLYYQKRNIYITTTLLLKIIGSPDFEDVLLLWYFFYLACDFIGETDSKPFVDCLLGDTTLEDFGDLWYDLLLATFPASWLPLYVARIPAAGVLVEKS